jgi:hypothetical protein
MNLWETSSEFAEVMTRGIAPNAPTASTTRRSQGLISGGFSASIGAWIQKPFLRLTLALLHHLNPVIHIKLRLNKGHSPNAHLQH